MRQNTNIRRKREIFKKRRKKKKKVSKKRERSICDVCLNEMDDSGRRKVSQSEWDWEGIHPSWRDIRETRKKQRVCRFQGKHVVFESSESDDGMMESSSGES
eukprot:TRINITY_DN4899_c0_g1_i1.p1 TRINITY_DN4899_c0_g1~~TRINITY_DN4899_c0_g1_i1.p1  ORF type:complete len:102 (+),score=28.82 TRINITY_DN4899_c0_g1_i1:137-442(+)